MCEFTAYTCIIFGTGHAENEKTDHAIILDNNIMSLAIYTVTPNTCNQYKLKNVWIYLKLHAFDEYYPHNQTYLVVQMH